ncbi:carboxypeptidase-like regulatory domain-containing protein [Candidatus Micrarchaeota archaeon]|nr:carboxypeptidase-like regulatory domain-containing protein [Candidatus Micrarchaeota archaeon]MBU1887320.1 carboxypeptidase-like regulatory domain-containing protein [Candidatus Micrarchaeota archaeon]
MSLTKLGKPVVLLLILGILISMNFATSPYYPPTDSDSPDGGGTSGDAEPKGDIGTNFITGCDGNTVYVYYGDGIPLHGARVAVIGPPIIVTGETDESGKFSFDGKSVTVRITITFAGLSPLYMTKTLIHETMCQTTETEITEEPDQDYECSYDSECGETEYCNVNENSIGGTCEPIQGCGKVENHELIPYVCGAEPSCPICPQGTYCLDNSGCIGLNLTGPEEANTGQDGVFYAFEGNETCVFCTLIIVRPDGSNYTMQTENDGSAIIHFDQEGQYIVIFQQGNAFASLMTEAGAIQPLDNNEDQKPNTMFLEEYYPYLGVVLIIIVGLGLLYYFKGRNNRPETQS